MTTATPAASQPAPDTAYTADEEARIIRNSSGLPVGIKPKMVWTWPKALLWAAIAIVCALAWSVLAIARGEQISAIWFVVVALSSYAIAYRFYAYYIQIKIMRTDDANATAAERVQDGANFERADRRVLFGQHFAAISGAGPLVGPILAAQMGYLPSVLWIILGVIFAGAVQDMLMLWISAKRRGRSFGQMATDEMGKVGGLIISVFLVVVTAIAMAFLALVAIKAMASSPWAVFSLGMTIPIALIMGCYERFLRPGRVIETTILGFVLLVLAIVGGGMIAANPVLAPIFTLNAKQLVVALVLYSFAAAALPHWLLVTPRDYLSTLMKIGTLALLVIGVVIANPQVQVPALTTLASRSNGPTFSGNLFPVPVHHHRVRRLVRLPWCCLLRIDPQGDREGEPDSHDRLWLDARRVVHRHHRAHRGHHHQPRRVFLDEHVARADRGDRRQRLLRLREPRAERGGRGEPDGCAEHRRPTHACGMAIRRHRGHWRRGA